MSATLTHAAAIIVSAVGASALNTVAVVSTAAATVLVWRTSSAAHRHTIWLAALVASAVAMIASPWAPGIPLPVKAPAVVSTARTFGLERSAMRETTVPSHERSIDDSQIGEPLRAIPGPAARHSISTDAPWTATIALLWLSVTTMILLRLAAGSMSLRHATKRLRHVTDSAWTTALRNVESTLATSRNITLVWGERHSAPATFGVRRPVIVLPEDASDWTDEQREVVLLHEVAHVVRGDVAAQMLANVICALLWFQPLIWFARWRLRAEAERAADDCVLLAGVAASSYADRLLEFARLSNAATKASRLAVGSVGMFTSSDLERRFKAMLDTTRSRSSSSRHARRAAVVFAVSIGVAVAGLRIASPATAMPVFAATRRAADMRGSATSSLPTVASRSNPLDHAIAAILAKPLDEFAVRTTPAQLRQPIDEVGQSKPDLSGTWIADTSSVSGPYRAASLPLTITVLQTDGMVAITMHGRAALGEDGSFIEPTPGLSWMRFVPLDGTVGVATLFGGARAGQFVKSDQLVSGAWHGDTLVMTTWHPKADSATVWKSVDRLTLAANGSLVNSTTIVIAMRDTLSSVISFTKAR